jgi:hypothetical protein
MGGLFVYAMLIGLCVYVVNAWLRWSDVRREIKSPKSRIAVTTIGFGSSSFSLAVIIALAIHALLTGGFHYYHPVLILAFRAGFLTALCGTLTALVGTGELEIPTIITSLLCLLIWFVEAMAQ